MYLYLVGRHVLPLRSQWTRKPPLIAEFAAEFLSAKNLRNKIWQAEFAAIFRLPKIYGYSNNKVKSTLSE